ncbi:hypothetical protein SAMN05446635_4040 [Burkholderia sp. OK233]|nr:hypothetical protein SAMN05446635_4040 [Burkholderia sp. OK233]
MGSGYGCPTHPVWRGVSQAKINFSKRWSGGAAVQQLTVCHGLVLAGLGFAGDMGL